MIIKVLNQGKGKVKNAVDYVFNQSKHKGQEISLIYGDRKYVNAVSNTTDFNKAVRKWKYFSMVVSFNENEYALLNQVKDKILDAFNRFLTAGGEKLVPYIVVEHREEDKAHWHIIGLRYDVKTATFYDVLKPGFVEQFKVIKAFLHKEFGFDLEQSYKTIAEHVFADTKEYMKRVRDEVLDKAVKQDPDVFKKVNVKHNEFVKEMQGKTTEEIQEMYDRQIPKQDDYVEVKTNATENIVIERKKEMDFYKREVNLIDFIVKHGGVIKSTPNEKTCRIAFQGRVLLVDNKEGKWLYYDTSTNAGGSIFDFFQNYLNIDNFGVIKNKLKEFLEHGAAEKSPPQLASKTVEDTKERTFSTANYTKIFDKLQHPLWKERKLNPNLFRRYLGDIYTDQRNNLCFPMVDDTGRIVGFEVKNIKHFKGNVGTRQGFTTLLPAGVDLKDVKIAVVGESILDCLSFLVLSKGYEENIALLSSAGNITETHLEMLKKLKEKGFSFILVFDNDEQGKKYTQEVINAIGKEYCIVQTPKNKDWNDDLMEQWRYRHENEEQEQI